MSDCTALWRYVDPNSRGDCEDFIQHKPEGEGWIWINTPPEGYAPGWYRSTAGKRGGRDAADE